VDNLLQLNPNGLYCAAGDFYIDPWNPVERAVITHAHADHLSAGSKSYLSARPCEALLRVRVGPEAAIESLPYGESLNINGVRVSFHPAGHILTGAGAEWR
jgi:putative mRNA 3-end processing factor